MSTVSYKEPPKEFEDTKSRMKKWRHEGPLSLIYPVLLVASKAQR
jgi:hypothetical protein